YSRTSENSIPCPLNTDRYSPVNKEFTRPRVRSSSSLTCRSTSGGTAGAAPVAVATANEPDRRGGGIGAGFERRKSENATSGLGGLPLDPAHHGPHHGLSILARTRCTIWSLVTSSASASYVVSTR